MPLVAILRPQAEHLAMNPYVEWLKSLAAFCANVASICVGAVFVEPIFSGHNILREHPEHIAYGLLGAVGAMLLALLALTLRGPDQ